MLAHCLFEHAHYLFEHTFKLNPVKAVTSDHQNYGNKQIQKKTTKVSANLY